MNLIRTIMALVFSFIILAPVVTFNFDEDAISLIDNRKLTANPLSNESLASGDLTENLQYYINDRLGFRDDMILSYTMLNDKIFNKMVHPAYIYGKDGYVFGGGLTVDYQYSEFHEAFADMVKKIQDYCNTRDVSFLFVLNPSKPAVLTEYIPKGINYDRSWYETFLSALDARGIRYIDNTPLLREKTEAGEVVFNKKYDANHWNDLGAYYGTNAMLRELQKDTDTIQLNDLNKLTTTQTLQTSLPVSEFPIHEAVPTIIIDSKLNTDNYAKYNDELERDPSFPDFGYDINEKRLREGAPKALVFQGSYMNGLGGKYLANEFGEYIHIHDYQNVIDFPYYFNIFKPDCVIFEVADSTLYNNYFNYDKMCNMDLNPNLRTVIDETPFHDTKILAEENITVFPGKTLTKIQWECNDAMQYVWLFLDEEYDMKKTENGYEITVLTECFTNYKNSLKIIALEDQTLITYKNN